VTSAQRQAGVRAAWAEQQRAAGLAVWQTPRVFTFNQYAERALAAAWARDGKTDRLLPAGAEWATLREMRREGGGQAEARALMNSVRTVHDWRVPRSSAALGDSPEAQLLQESLVALERLAIAHGRRPLRDWLGELEPASESLTAAGFAILTPAQQATLQRLGGRVVHETSPGGIPAVATAENDEHELELIAAWCREQLERDPQRRLLIVDSKLRQRRPQYERLLSQTLTPSEWLTNEARTSSTRFTIEGGRPLAEFPVIGHAVLSLRLLTGRLRFLEVVQWLNLPFLDGDDVMASAAIEAVLRTSRKLEYSAAELAALLERAQGTAPAFAAARLRASLATLSGERRSATDWSPRLLTALRQVGWPGSRPLRSDEQQTVARWHALLDEYSALGTWLPRATATEAVAALTDLATERHFDPASVDAPVTLTESHDDPLVRYDAIWVAGLDAAQWPSAARPDAFIPSRLQSAAGIPTASAAGQVTLARAALAAWRRATDALVCSWARLEGEAQRSPSPLLARLGAREEYRPTRSLVSLGAALAPATLESFEDDIGIPIDTRVPVAGGVTPLTLQAECGFRAYGEMRLGARALEAPAPGIDARERGMLLHKALELVWDNLDRQHFSLIATTAQDRRPMIANAVHAAEVHVFRGHVPLELRPAVEREKHRLERLIERLLDVETRRTPFVVDKMETRRKVGIAGGEFELRIDRIDLIEGGGYAILDYKAGEPRKPRWDGEQVREPQLLAYLLAERGRNVQALANVSLTRGRARFIGHGSRKGLLPDIAGMPGMNPNKVPAEQIEATWQAEVERWLTGLQRLGAGYIAGHAPVQPAPDVCRLCHLTTLCRRVELAASAVGHEDEHE
jgi:ATP-dependent helicase/nuclease subunit B